MTKFVICDTLLDTSAPTIGPTNPCQVKWFDKWSHLSGLPHWVGSSWYAQLFPDEASAQVVIDALIELGEEAYMVSVDNLEP
jgi:hypothetical protein